jgi:hypothetical protein
MRREAGARGRAAGVMGRVVRATGQEAGAMGREASAVRRAEVIKAAFLLMASAALGCAAEEAPNPVSGPLHGDLASDIREQASVEIREKGAEIDVSIKLSKGYGVAPPGAVLDGQGRAEPFPEAGMTLYTARFDAPADSSGPCGADPVSLALSLERRGDGARVSGSLAAYCGKGVFHGEPARIVRLSGNLAR